MVQVRLARKQDKKQWDNFVRLHPEATPYHLFAWKKAVENAYKHESHYLLAEENEKIIGVLPLFFMRLPFISSQLISLPFCDVGGCLVEDVPTEMKLLQEAVAIARKIKASSIEIRTRRQNFSPLAEGLTMTTRTDKVSMLLPLPGSSEALWEGFRSKLRSQIRKAEKNNLAFVWGEKKDRKAFYNACPFCISAPRSLPLILN